MEEFLYLEADEEITSVIDKLRGLEAKSVGLVAPRGSMIAQSLVSLKLLQKEAKKFGKQIALVTSDEVGRNLAAQVGLSVYADVKSSKPLEINPGLDESSKKPIEIDMRERAKQPDDKNSNPDDKSARAEKAEEALDEEPLPKDFTMHRYDEPREAAQTVQEVVDEPQPKAEERHDTSANEEHFIKRPVGDLKDYSRRQEVEDSRPVRYQEVKRGSSRSTSNKKPVIIAIFSVVAVVLLAIIADLTLSRLTVVLNVKADPIDKTVEVRVEKDRSQIDADAGIIPGTEITKEKDVEATITSTGEKNAGEAAKGIIAFKNESGVDEPISAGSTIVSSNSVEFTLDSDITVPKASLNSAGDKVLGQVSGAITAKEAGTQGNMSSSTVYAVRGKSKITATGATTGGVTKKVKIVTKTDIEKGKQKLQDDNLQALISEAKDSNKDKVFLDDAGSVELTDYQAGSSVNDEADQFTVKGKLSYSVLVFSQADLADISAQEVEKTLSEGEGLARTDSDQIIPTVKEAQISQGYLVISSEVKSHVGPKIDMEEQALSWRGKQIKRVKEIAGSIEGVEVSSVELKPSWALPIAPIIYKHIDINVEYSPKSDSGS